MPFAGLNYLAIVIAALVSLGFGALWYTFLGNLWLAATGKTPAEVKANVSPVSFIITGLALLLMSWMLAGVLGHLGFVDVWHGIVTALFLWAGFIATTLTVNHRFQGASWLLTFIDAGYWLAALLIEGAIIGAFGA
jgi:hypothetical protein